MNYRDEVLSNCPNFKTDSPRERYMLGGLGLSGEAGEVTDLIKKFCFHGRPVDRDLLIKELGDVLWYVEYLAACLDVPTEKIREANVEKLRARHPNGWSPESANAYADKCAKGEA